MRRVATIDCSGDWLALRFPFSAELVAHLKARFHPADRRWDPDAKAWLIAPDLLAELRELVQKFFPVRETGRYAPPPPPAPTPANDYEELLGGLPLDGLRRVYRAVMLEAHPDRGGDLRLAQRINAAWERLERRLAKEAA